MDPHQPPGQIHPQQPPQVDPQQAPDPQVDPQQGQQMHPQQPPPMHPQQPQVHPQQAPHPQGNPQQAALIPHQMYLQQPPQMDPQQAPNPQVDPQQMYHQQAALIPHQMYLQQDPQVHPQQVPHPQVNLQQAQQMHHQQAPHPQMDPQQAPLMHPQQMYPQQPPPMHPQQPQVHPQQAPHPQVDPQQAPMMYPHQMYLQQAPHPQVDPQQPHQMDPQQPYQMHPQQMYPQQVPHPQMVPQQPQQMHPQQMYLQQPPPMHPQVNLQQAQQMHPQQPHQMPPPQAPHQQMDPQQAQLMDLQQAQQRYHLQLHPLVYPSPFPQINFQNIPQMRPRQARLRLPPHPLLIPRAQELNLPPDSPPKQRLKVREARVYNLPEDKYIQLMVHMEPNITKPVIKVPRFRFYFLDTLLSDIKDILQISQYAPYDYFEYEEDGDWYSVRTDAEVKELVNSLMPQPLHIHLRSNRMFPNAPLRSSDLALPLSDITRERVIASGHFGEVSRGYDRANNRVIAVKKIKNFLGDAEKLLLCDEVNILRMSRRCHYVVYFYNALCNNSELMLVFEFMNGLSLDKYGVLPVHVHAAVSICVVEGLTFLWKNNVMHRDIKPSNILVNTKGEVKITDFGTSRIIKDKAVVYSEVGTQAYLSPEQTSGNPYSLPSEVWSLGITLAEMAIGTAALFPEPHSQVCNVPRHVEQNLPNINERLAAFDVGLHILVIWCLLMNPAWRLDWRDVIHRAYIVCNRPIRHDFIARAMKNLHIYRSASTPADTVTGVLAMAIDAANELTYFALRDRIIAVGTDMNVVNTFEWDFDGLGQLVMFDFLVDEMVLCAILSSGEILLVSTNDGSVTLETELRGVDIIGGAWSPDLGQLIVVTPDKLMALSREFVVDYDVDLYHAAPGKEQLQTIGWGARETQFQGLAGKQKRERIDPDTVPGGLNPNDDRRVLVSWRGDAQYFTVSTVEERPNPLKAQDPDAPAKVEARHLRVWSRDMELMSQCEPLNGMEPALSMRPTGNLMAVPRVRDGKRDLWLYERNGQWRSHFTVGDADSEVVSVGWNIDSTVLLIHLRRNGVDLLQFWTVSNYDWALKAETENQKLLTAKWDPESPRRLHFVTVSGQYGFLEVEPGYNSRDCLIVSIAGGDVRVTDLTKAPMPPPMFHAVLSSGKTGVLLLTQSKYGLALLLSDMRLVTYRLENREYTPLSSVKLTNPLPQLPINLQWTNESAVSFICGRDVFAVDVLNGNEKLIITAPKQLVYHRRSPSNDAWFFLAVDGSWMSFADGNMSPSLLAVKFPVNSVDTHRCNIVDLGNRYILFGLNRNNQLLIDGHVVHQAVGHISYGSDAFLVTTLHHQLFAMSYDRLLELLAAPPKQTAKNSVFGWFAEGSGRAVERGSAVVAHESDGVRVFLQMPRGNLETVEPRFRLVPCLRQLIGAKRYRDAIAMMRRQRVDMNLLYDHDPDAFIANVVDFVEQVKNADLLNLFIFSLNEADTTRTSFAPFYPERANTPAPPSGKVARTAEAVLKAVLDTKDIKKRQKIYTAALSCFLKREPRGIKEAFLDLRAQVKAAGEVLQQTNEQYVNQTPSLFRRWTKHIRYFVKDGELFKAALQTYDLELAYEVADEINMDPREFLPLLESLKAKDNDAYRRYHIDLVVEDYEAALEHIADAEDKIDECIDHIKRHNLYSKALIVFNGKTNYNRIAQVCAENALSQRRHKEAGLLFEQAGDYLNALKAHELAMNVLDYVAAARRVPLDAPAIQRSLTVFALKFEQQGRYVQAAETYKMLDVKANLSKVVENFARAQNWSTALLEYNLHPFVESDARPKLIKEASSRYRTVLSELRSHLNEINTHAARLEILRAEKAKTVEEWVENEGDVDVAQSETMSEASSASGVSSISNISRLSRMSAAQAKRRKNVERKKKNVKQGSQYEDIGILTALTELFAKISNIQTELAELLPTLVALSLLSEARELQKEAERVVKAAADRRVDVWPRYLKPNNLPGPLHEIYRCEDGIIRMPGEGHMPTRIYLEDELFPPKFDTNLSWKLKALD